MYYMVVSVLTSAAFFMLTGMTDRTRITDPSTDVDEDMTAQSQPIYVAYGIKAPSVYRDDDEEIGIPIPATMAFLGLMFVCCVLLVAGLPPLPGFVGKLAVLSAAVKSVPQTGDAKVWLYCGAVLLSGLTAVIGLSRVGMRLF